MKKLIVANCPATARELKRAAAVSRIPQSPNAIWDIIKSKQCGIRANLSSGSAVRRFAEEIKPYV